MPGPGLFDLGINRQQVEDLLKFSLVFGAFLLANGVEAQTPSNDTYVSSTPGISAEKLAIFTAIGSTIPIVLLCCCCVAIAATIACCVFGCGASTAAVSNCLTGGGYEKIKDALNKNNP